MTRLTDVLMHRVGVDPMKKFSNYRQAYPYKQVLPAALGNKVSGRSDKKKPFPCIQEMSLMLACFQKHDSDESRCSKEIESFKKCFVEHEKIKDHNDGRSSADAVNAVLAKYPQPKERKA